MAKGWPMDCESLKNYIPSILSGDVSEDEHRRAAHHLQTCRQCRHAEAEMAHIWSLLDRVGSQEPSKAVKSRLMAAAQVELGNMPPAWWKMLLRPSFFRTVSSALGLSLIISLIFPYDRAVALCEQNILNGGIFAFLPQDLVYFLLGVLYGLVPVALAEFFCSKTIMDRPGVMGFGAGLVTAAFLIPFFVVQCPQFTFSLVLTMVLGITAGATAGGLGTSMALNRLKRVTSR